MKLWEIMPGGGTFGKKIRGGRELKLRGVRSCVRRDHERTIASCSAWLLSASGKKSLHWECSLISLHGPWTLGCDWILMEPQWDRCRPPNQATWNGLELLNQLFSWRWFRRLVWSLPDRRRPTRQHGHLINEMPRQCLPSMSGLDYNINLHSIAGRQFFVVQRRDEDRDPELRRFWQFTFFRNQLMLLIQYSRWRPCMRLVVRVSADVLCNIFVSAICTCTPCRLKTRSQPLPYSWQIARNSFQSLEYFIGVSVVSSHAKQFSAILSCWLRRTSRF